MRIVKSLIEGNKMFKICKNKPNDQMKKQEYENYRKSLDKTIKLAKRKYYEKKINNSKHELKALWKLVKRKGFTASASGIKEIQSDHGHSIQEHESIANELINIFVKKVTPKDSFFLKSVTEKQMEETL
ncbi:hypothetical protein WA026_008641 [Henosepilachna vigintioctopunctata]|uniref:Uncharacterized protein n=1 Tax=Henosepilachna vigintioctopunctata TaxID=420089 RepID=A0AAW1UK56_9CUCU